MSAMCDQRYDVVKGMAMTLVVLSHAQVPDWLRHFGKLFHVQLFFILAGWLFGFEHSKDFRGCYLYVRSKIIR